VFFFQAEDGIRDYKVTGVQTCALPICVCLMYPLRPPVLVPTFIVAWVGADAHLPSWQHAFADPRARQATELMVRLLRDKAAYEANLFDENNNFLVAGSVFPYFYALVGERNPKQPPKPGPRSEYSQLAADAA